jgi:hypothetical protein
MAGPSGPFESTFERLGDTLINKVADEIFGDSGAARQTIVVVYNHGNQECLRIVTSNPYADNSAQADAQGGITVNSTFSVGDSNQVGRRRLFKQLRPLISRYRPTRTYQELASINQTILRRSSRASV